jgi:hypothetical protein
MKVALQSEIVVITDNKNYFKDRFPRNALMLTPKEVKEDGLRRNGPIHRPIYIDNQCYTNGANEVHSIIMDKLVKDHRELKRQMLEK